MNTFQEKCWQNLDKLILCFLFLVTLGTAVFMSMRMLTDEGVLDWARHNTDLVLAGLLGLMGGRAWSNYTNTTVDNTKVDATVKPPPAE